MTLIIGLRHEGFAYLGSDSGGVSEGPDGICVQAVSGKVFPKGSTHSGRSPLLVGALGNPRAADLVHYSPGLVPPKGEDPRQYLALTFVPWLRGVLSKNGFRLDPTDEDDMESHGFVVVLHGRLFRVDAFNGSIESDRSYLCEGQGRSFAEGYLTALVDGGFAEALGLDKDPQAIIRHVMEVTKTRYPALVPPFPVHVVRVEPNER